MNTLVVAGSNFHEATDSWTPGGLILGIVILILVFIGIRFLFKRG